jgi:large subunit ribosomal protein L3
MPLGLLGTKVGMSQIYEESGKIAPVTVIQCGPCPVLQVRNQQTDGYDAVQLGFKDKERRKATKPERGHVSAELEARRRRNRAAAGIQLPPKANCEPQRFIREFRLETGPASGVEVGKLLTVGEVFKDVKAVDVIGTSKGRGFTGAMKRHNFHGLKASHGVKKVHRSAGSMGSHASNRGSGRPKKGHKGAGQYGNRRVTVRNLRIVKIDGDNNLLVLEGAIPGPNGGIVMIRPSNRRQAAAPAAAAPKSKK